MSEQEQPDISSSYPKFAKGIDLYFMGLTIVIGGQYFSWNAGLAGGFWEYFVSTILTGLAYFALVLCLGEMTSALPFSGGVYGFIRATIGPFSGYIVGVCEVLQNIVYVSATAIPLAQMIRQLSNQSIAFEPLYWVLFYVSSLFILIAGNHILWKFNLIVGIVSLVILLIYIFGSFSFAQFDSYAEASSSSAGSYSFSGEQMMEQFHLASWFYIGVQSLPLCCNDCTEPRKQIPWAMTICQLTLFITAILVYFFTCSQAPGTSELASAAFPLNYGFARMFGISENTATWLSLPATYATGFGFMFCYGRQISAMSKSGLLPALFQHTTSYSHTPDYALLFGTLISFVLVVIIHYAIPSFLENLFLLCMLASYLIYCFAFVAYILFIQKYSTVSREFKNPFGIASAIFGMIVFGIGFIGVLGFQDGNWVPIVIFVIYLTLASVYYFFHALKHQKFSLDEQKALFTAYVINANANTRNSKKKKRRGNISLGSRGSVGSAVSAESRKRSKHNSVAPMSSQASSMHSDAVLDDDGLSESEAGGGGGGSSRGSEVGEFIPETMLQGMALAEAAAMKLHLQVTEEHEAEGSGEGGGARRRKSIFDDETSNHIGNHAPSSQTQPSASTVAVTDEHDDHLIKQLVTRVVEHV